MGNLQSPTATILWIRGVVSSCFRLPMHFYILILYSTYTDRISTNFFAANFTSSSLLVPARTIFPDLNINAVHRGSRILTIRAPNLYLIKMKYRTHLWIIFCVSKLLHYIFKIHRFVDIDCSNNITTNSETMDNPY